MSLPSLMSKQGRQLSDAFNVLLTVGRSPKESIIFPRLWGNFSIRWRKLGEGKLLLKSGGYAESSLQVDQRNRLQSIHHFVETFIVAMMENVLSTLSNGKVCFLFRK
mmetsp:Transcript_15356/g.20175  ORF Transcript_15356/g.20175 Transcript_15356/m.20175 type:complete len:107 (+) Transcript_15356:48-368(+)